MHLAGQLSPLVSVEHMTSTPLTCCDKGREVTLQQEHEHFSVAVVEPETAAVATSAGAGWFS